MSALLPRNATAWDIAGSLTSAARRPLDSDIIRRVWSPWECPADLLPYLAHAFSVDLWYEEWTETRKRSIIANAVAMHRLKGTLAGIERYLAYTGATLLNVVTPPAKVYSGASLTRAQRESWLSRLPQVRVWLFREGGISPEHKLFSGGQRTARQSFFEGNFPQPSTALSRLRRRARWVVDGVETDARVDEFGSYYRVHLSANAGTRVFCNRAFGAAYFAPSEAWRRLVTIAPRARLAWRSPVGPSLEAVTSEPERVKVAGTRGRSVFCNKPLSGYFVRSTARFRIFDRYAVNDGSQSARRPAVQFMGVGRYGFPAHTARLRLSIPGRRNRFSAGDGVCAPKLHFWLPHDGRPLAFVRRALICAKRRTDVLQLDIGPRPRFIAGHLFRADIDSKVVGKP